MLPFSFEDRYPTNYGTGFGATNEEPFILKKLVKSFRNGLAIASGGEVTFLVLLPRARKQLVLIDHSYSSLRAFTLKSLLLATLGAEATRNLFLDESTTKLKDAIHKVRGDLPACLNTSGTVCDKISSETQNLRREWFYADLRSLKASAKNLHKIKLIHGDLTDTKEYGPFDFVYLSNALEHTGRPALCAPYEISPNPKTLRESLMKPGTSVVWAVTNRGFHGTNLDAKTRWGIETEILGYRTTWRYCLSKIK